VARRLVDRPKGLVVVTGPTGSGKSTTLAALLEAINQRHRRRVITIEDPIEYAFMDKQCLISQREVGRDTASFADALRAAVRQDQNVLLVGEMRDLDTMAAAITAAETGHLVLTTLHAIDCTNAIDRILDVFPPTQQPQIRTQLSESLLAVFAQQLLPALDPHFGTRAELRGRVLACEVLLGPMADVMAVRSQIRDGGKNLYTTMETGAEVGMQTMEAALAGLVRTRLISEDTAMRVSVRQKNLQALLERR
jgi:twitching motility protein PilT